MLEKFFKPLFIGLVVFLLLLGLHYINWLQPAENMLVKISAPVQRLFFNSASGVKNFYSDWLTKRELLKENQAIKDRLAKFTADEAKIKSLTEENELLKRELAFVGEKPMKYVAAKIITGVSDPVSRSVIISAGKNSGLAKGMAVVADHGILVGKIYEVYDDFSKALLLTDNKSKVAATVQNQDMTIGLVEGQFGLSFSMTNIPQNQGIKEGDLVVTSGLEGLIPKNLLIAQVESINQIESEIFKTATLRPIISLDNLSDVLVVIP